MTDATAREARKAGWYHVKRATMPDEVAWTIAEWDEDVWWLIGDRENYDDDIFAEIDERPIERPPRAAPPAGELPRVLPWECSECADHPKLTHHGEGKFRCPSCDRLYFQHGTPAWERNFNPGKSAPAGELAEAVVDPHDAIAVALDGMYRNAAGDWPQYAASDFAELLRNQGCVVQSLAAAERAGQERRAAEAWQPIETAPRDGTWFLACATEPGWKATRLVRFAHPDDRMPIHGEGVMWPSAPTHWMPLPEPPAIRALPLEDET